MWGILWEVSVIFSTTCCESVTNRRMQRPLVRQWFGGHPTLRDISAESAF
jgi:hypothetical protein